VVATILRLRLTTTIHQLRGEGWRVLVLIGGAIWALTLLPSVAWTAHGLAARQADVRMDAYTAIIAVLVVGWAVVPVLVSGLDDSLEPGRFSSFGASAGRLMPGLTVSAFVTIPALFFLVALTMFATSWWSDGVGTFAVAFVGGLLSLATMVFSARVTVLWASRLLQSRRSREASFLAMFVAAFLLAPLASVVLADGLDTLLAYDLRPVLGSIRTTPIGSPIGAAGAAAAGDWSAAAAGLGLAAAWVLLLWLVWRVNVAHVLVHPVYRGGGARPRDDRILAAARRAERRSASRFAFERPTVAGVAVTARAIRYWFSDPRYLAAIVSVAVFPILFFFLVYPAFGSPVGVVVAVPIMLAGTIGWGRHNDLAFDSSALWLDVVSGKLGRDVMRGRVVASLMWSVPVVFVGVGAAAAIARRPDLLPAMTGASLGVLGTSLGISALTSILLPYRAPAPGENPFSAEVGSAGAGLLAQAVSSITAWVVAVPVVLPLVAALVWSPEWGWLGLVTGTATGFGVLVLSIRRAGVLYDRKSGRLVAAVS